MITIFGMLLIVIGVIGRRAFENDPFFFGPFYTVVIGAGTFIVWACIGYALWDGTLP